MIKAVVFAIVLAPLFSFSQNIVIEKYSVNITTAYSGQELRYIDSLFQHTQFTIAIAQLLPKCENGRCYEESIILEEFNRERSIKDSSEYVNLYFQGIDESLIDTSNYTEVDPSDYPPFLTSLLEGPKKLGKNEIVDMCYNPRHAIIYRDITNNKVIAVEEVCFECGHTKIGLYTSEMHHNKSARFKELFQQYGMIE